MTAAVGKKAAAMRARELLKQQGITAPPVPVERLAKVLGASVRYAPLDDALSGMAHVQGDTAIIGVNAMHHPNRQRFTIAHEIAHLLLHRDYLAQAVHVDKEFVINRDEVAASGTDALEIDANTFAAELLMPAEWVLAAMPREVDFENEKAIAEVAKKFRVSVAALQTRLINLSR